MYLLTRFELKYIYENSPVDENQETVFDTFKTAKPTKDFLHNYKFCTVRRPEQDGVAVAVMSRPTIESIYNCEDRLIEEDDSEILLESESFSTNS